MSNPSSNITFVIGAPGSGKGTLCKILAKHHHYYHLSVGDYLRELRDSGTFKHAGLEGLDRYLSSRELIPPEPIIAILKAKIAVISSTDTREILVDGFPRNLESAKLWDLEVSKPNQVLHFDCEKEEAKKRFLLRARDEDDDEEVFEKRYGEFAKNNAEIVQHYGGIVTTIDTSQETEVSKQKLFEVLGLEIVVSRKKVAL